jgi:phage-related tail fiber protein
MLKNRISTMACLALVISVLAVGIGTIVKLTADTSFAITAAPGNQTGEKMMSGNMTGTNTTNGMMHVQICTSSYPCANTTNTTAGK